MPGAQPTLTEDASLGSRQGFKGSDTCRVDVASARLSAESSRDFFESKTRIILSASEVGKNLSGQLESDGLALSGVAEKLERCQSLAMDTLQPEH